MEKHYFPLFIDLTGRRVLVVGGGAVAERRVRALLPFGCSLTVVAPAVSPGIAELADQEKIRLEKREYREGDEDGCALVLAATNDRAVNHTAVQRAEQAGAFYNAADCKEECSFFFPGIAIGGGITAGVTANGRDHRLARWATERIRALLEAFAREE